jgi:acyl transferase domain-containing protein
MEPIAIVGLDCHFPNAKNKEDFWQLLYKGQDAISLIPENRWDKNAFYNENPSGTGCMNTQCGGFIENPDAFDAEFFGISPREAESMDPQQRLLLQIAWRAIEDAGISPIQLSGSYTGVFVGIMGNEWAHLHLTDYQNITAQVGSGNGYCIVPNRISYQFNFKGPSLAIDTACSSSLVAVHNACNSLQAGECDWALAGGVNLILTPALNIFYTQAGLSAPDGRCKPFSQQANGIGRGEGLGMVVLRRLSEAVADHQRIYAIIKGSAVNQNGRGQGLTAPNRWSQQEVMERAYRQAQVSPSQITFIEAHGTGTTLGDLIEVKALKQIHQVPRPHPCYFGSLKSNIGHLEGAAGIAGLIKVSLSLYHKCLPATLHCQEENPHLQLNGKFLQLTKDSLDLSAEAVILAGLSSFGLGGTNGHMVLQNYQAVNQPHPDSCQPRLGLFTLSAKTPQSLQENIEEHLNYFSRHSESELAAICYCSNRVKADLSTRLAFSADSLPDLREKLREYLQPHGMAQARFRQIKPNVQPKIAFLFTGQGSQYSGMTRSLYQGNGLFRTHLDACDAAFEPHLGVSIKEIIFNQSKQALLDQTQFTQPALFAIQYALAKFWQALGVNPCVMVGHSIGEYAAAVRAEVMSLDDAAFLISQRGKLMESLPPGGGMLAVQAREVTFTPWLTQHKEQLAVAAYNGEDSLVLSGTATILAEIQKYCQEQGIKAKFLQVSQAFHSPLMQPLLEKFHKEAAKCNYSPPKLPIISSLTGELLTQKTAINAEYWTNHIAKPVKYFQACQHLQRFNITHAIEIGPKPILTVLAQLIHPQAATKWLPSVHANSQDIETLYNTISELYLDGGILNWNVLYNVETLEKISLPGYKFSTKQCYWFKNKPIQGKVTSVDRQEIIATSPASSVISPVAIKHQRTPENILAVVLGLTASIGGYQPSEIAATAQFSEELGYDSIMLMQLKNRIEQALPEVGKLSVTELLSHVTYVQDLANFLDQKIQQLTITDIAGSGE